MERTDVRCHEVHGELRPPTLDAHRGHEPWHNSWERWLVGSKPRDDWRLAGEFRFSAPDWPAGRRRSQEVHGKEANVYEHECLTPSRSPFGGERELSFGAGIKMQTSAVPETSCVGLGFWPYYLRLIAGWSSPVARQAHNLKVAGSNPAPATNLTPQVRGFFMPENRTGSADNYEALSKLRSSRGNEAQTLRIYKNMEPPHVGCYGFERRSYFRALRPRLKISQTLAKESRGLSGPRYWPWGHCDRSVAAGISCLPYPAASCCPGHKTEIHTINSLPHQTTRLEARQYGKGWLPLQGAQNAFNMIPLLNECAYIWSKLCQL